MYFIRNVSAHWHKIIASYLKWVHLGIPLLGISIFLAYFQTRKAVSSMDKMNWYLQALCCVFPLVIAVVTTILYEFDERAGGCQMLLVIPMKRAFGHISNFVALLFLGLLSTLISIVGFGIGLYVLGGKSFLLWYGISQSMIVFFSYVALYLLTYMITYSFGIYIGLGFGIVGVLCSALCILPLGDRIWVYIPFSYGIRISLGYLYIHSGANKVSEVLFYKDVLSGIPKVIVITILIGFIFAIWAEKWQNKSQVDA